MLEDEDHVYFFLREQAVEYIMLLIKIKVDVIDVFHSDQVTGSLFVLFCLLCCVVFFFLCWFVCLEFCRMIQSGWQTELLTCDLIEELTIVRHNCDNHKRIFL